ncbi:MAG: SDR family NAD(P)-dependent oxidoreductase, partial [Pseudomonadota bacterium]
GGNATGVEIPEGVTFLPVRVGRLRLYAAGSDVARARVRLKKLSPRGAEAEMDLLDEDGALVAEVSGLRLKAFTYARSAKSALYWRQRLTPLANADHSVEAPSDWDDPMARAKALSVAADEAPEPDVGALLVDALGRRLAWDIAHRFADKAGSIDVASAIDLAPSARPLLSRALIALEEDGVFESGELGSGALTGECPYPPLDELILALSEEAPERVPDLMALLKLEAELPQRLTEGLLESTPVADVVDISPTARAIWRGMAALAGDLMDRWVEDARLEVLIVGSPSLSVISEIAGHERVSGVAITDADEAIVDGLAQVVSARPGLRIAPFEDAVAKGGYDLILAGDAMARLGSDALPVACGALASGGIFAAIEPAPDLLTDLRRGAASDWWEGTATPEAPIGRRAPAEDWLTELESARMTGASAAPLAASSTEASVIIAKAPSRAAAAEQAENGDRTLVVLHDGGARTIEMAEEIEAALAIVGCNVLIGPADEPPAATTGEVDMIFLPGLFADSAEDMERAQARIAVVHGLLAQASPTRLWLITRGGRPTSGADAIERCPAEAALWGLGRVLSNEPGSPEIRTVDFNPVLPTESLVESLAEELSSPRADQEVIIDGASRRSSRVEAATDIDKQAEAALAGSDSAFVLDIRHQGSFDSLAWGQKARRAPEADEVEIEVRATGLNFRDVMWAQGLLPEEALEDGFAGPTLGMECAGVVTRAGASAGVSVGDEVIAFGPACFASHMTVASRAVAPLPEGTDFDTAASVPTIFITAQYSLVELARLSAGETVLIHGGAGGVGLAAIQIARRIGATIIATAGSDPKRRLLRAMGVDHVFDSRSLDFADQVMAVTDGRGVDVVLNSLFGEAMERSLGCLRPFGRFVELGKRDYYANAPIGLRPFRRNLTYFGVDADQLLSERPEIADSLFADLAQGFADGDFTPPPCQVFEAEEIVDAFRLMQKSGHVGKIVVRPLAAPVGAPTTQPEIGEGAWLIVGGLGGFGVETAAWLAEKGIKKLWLTSRSGEADRDCKAIIAALRKADVSVEVVANDASKPGDVDALMAEIAADDTPLKGVVHSAMVLDDTMFETLTPKRIEAVIKPKIAGAALLDQATRGLGLDHFFVYSSVTSLFGNPGQAPYVAANSYLESLMAMRRAANEPGLAVAWGPIADIGYLSREEKTRDMLEKRMGGGMLTSAQALAALDRLLLAGAPDAATTIAPMRWGKLAADLPLLSTPLFAHVEQARDPSGEAEGEIDLRELIDGKDDATALKIVIDLLAGETGRILRQPPSELDPKKPLTEMGFDSLMAVDLKMAVEEKIGANLPMMALSEGVSLAALSRKLLDEARGEAQAAVLEESVME